jgi:hypothetical protein
MVLRTVDMGEAPEAAHNHTIGAAEGVDVMN